MKPTNKKFSRPRGMTILEMVMSMAVMSVVFSAAAGGLRAVQTNWTSRQWTAETIQNGRVLTDHLNHHLATATRVISVSSPDTVLGFIEFIDNLGATMRYEVDDNNYVRFGQVGNLSEIAGPVTQLKFFCYGLENIQLNTQEAESIRLVRAETDFLTGDCSRNFTTDSYIQTNANTSGASPSIGVGIAVKDEIMYGGSWAVLDSYHSSQGSYNSSTAGSNAILTVNSKNSDSVFLYNGAQIKGDVYLGPKANIDNAIKLYSGSQITGNIDVLEDQISISNIAAPGQGTLGGNSGSISTWGNMIVTVDEDSCFDDIGLWGTSKLRIQGNITILVKNSLSVGNDASIEIMPNSSLTLYVKNDCSIGGKLNANTEDPSKLHIRMSGNNKTFNTYNQAEVYALLENPKGDVSLWNRTPFFGRIRCDSLEGDSPIHVDLDSDFPDGSQAFGGQGQTVLP